MLEVAQQVQLQSRGSPCEATFTDRGFTTQCYSTRPVPRLTANHTRSPCSAASPVHGLPALVLLCSPRVDVGRCKTFLVPFLTGFSRPLWETLAAMHGSACSAPRYSPPQCLNLKGSGLKSPLFLACRGTRNTPSPSHPAPLHCTHVISPKRARDIPDPRTHIAHDWQTARQATQTAFLVPLCTHLLPAYAPSSCYVGVPRSFIGSIS